MSASTPSLRTLLTDVVSGSTANNLDAISSTAALFVATHHSSQSPSGKDDKPSWFINGLQIASILNEIGCDNETLSAAILFGHDDLFNVQAVSLDALFTQIFSADVSLLIQSTRRLVALRELSGASGALSQANQHETLRRMLLAMVADHRVAVIYLAAALNTMRRFALEKRAPELNQCAEIFLVLSPLANRLGLWQLKWELEDLAFRFSEPMAYKTIASQLHEKRVERALFVENFRLGLENMLRAKQLKVLVAGRPKHIYSIHKKMLAKSLGITELSDLHAFRVLVDSVKDCYSVLSIVHDAWVPVHGEYDDYIARPKSNGYESLHTVVLADDGRRVEIQIRTHAMHAFAESGVAAHWRYKEGVGLTGKPSVDQTQEARVTAMRQLLAWQQDVAQSISIPEAAHVYAMTPQARVVELPKGSTPVDFAYHVHSDLGHKCRGAKVNGQLVPLTTVLENGQTVDIVLAKANASSSANQKIGPSRDWLNPKLGFLASSRAKTKVRQWFNAQEEARLAELAVPPPEAAVGSAAITTEQNTSADLLEILNKPRADSPDRKGDILVVGVDFLMTQLAKCCRPLPPDPITGFVTRGNGISIHRASCKTLRNMATKSPERLLASAWGQPQQALARLYPVEVTVHAYDRQGLLRDVSDTFAREKINVTAASTQSRDQIAYMRFTVDVASAKVLGSALHNVMAVPGVFEAKRRH
jgi:GTP pyrophosphokinase